MPNSTGTKTAVTTGWTEFVGAGEQALITPLTPGESFLVRYSATDPGADEKKGHKYFAKDDIPNAVIGSTNTEKGWVRSISSEVSMEVTVL